jgi:hypothetical protein
MIGCSNPAHINMISVSNEIVRVNIKNMPLVDVLESLDSALQQNDSRYSLHIFNTNYWNGTRIDVEYPFTKDQKMYTVSNMPLISFSTNYCTLEGFVDELKKQSRWSMWVNKTNDMFIISGRPVDDDHSR